MSDKEPLTCPACGLSCFHMPIEFVGDKYTVQFKCSECGLLGPETAPLTREEIDEWGIEAAALKFRKFSALYERDAITQLRGHDIYWNKTAQEYRFCDTDEPTAETWFERPCGHCGLYGNSSDGYPDPCLGALPGVTNACCGHGDPESAYMCFQGGLVIRGFEVSEFHQRHMSDEEQQVIVDYIKELKRFRELPPQEKDHED